MTSGRSGHVFKNWSLTQCCQPDLYFEPSSEDDLRQVLESARLKEKTVKVIGCGYSSNSVNCTDGYMISLKNMNRIIEIDEVKKTVKVEAGILISDLNEVLAENDLALSVVGFVSNIAVGSVVSTGYHGSGMLYGALEDYVLELSLMKSDGEVMTLTCLDEDKDTFHAATLSLGALGIIVSVKLQCEQAFRLQQVSYAATLEDVIDNIDSHVSSSDHFRLTWFPHTDRCTLFHINRTTEPVTHTNSSWFSNTFIGFSSWLMELLFWLSTFYPLLVPWINRLYSRLLSRRRRLVERSDRVFVFPCTVRNDCAEWSVPRGNFASVLKDFKRLVDHGSFYVNFPVDVRFVKRSTTCMLSPHGDTDSVYFNILTWHPYSKVVPCDKLHETIKTLMLMFGGKPHWGKRQDLTSDELMTSYKSLLRFIDVRNRLDPRRMFANDYLKRVLGD